MSTVQYTIPFKHGDRVVEIGGGEQPLVRPNVDVRKLLTVDVVCDLSVFPWPLETAAFDGVLARYLWEHFSWRDSLKFAQEVHRLLAPGGVAVLYIPNTYEQFRQALMKKPSEWDEKMAENVFGSQSYGPEWRYNAHYSLFSPEYAVKLLLQAGFSKADVYAHPDSRTDCICEAVQ